MTAIECSASITCTEDEVLNQAEALAKREQWKEAASCLRARQQNHELSLYALSKLAYYSSHASDFDEAICLYRDLCQQQPSKADWYYCLGYQFQQKEQWSEAIPAYEKAFELAPRLLKIALRLGEAYQENDQPAKALDVFKKGIHTYQQYPEDQRSKLTPFYANLCAEASRILLADSSSRPEAYGEAITLCKESVKADSNNGNNSYRIGCALLEINRAEEALEYLSMAKSLTPHKEYVDHKMAQAHLRKGDIDQALKSYNLIPQHRRAPYILHGMGQCYMNKGEFMEAARHFHQAIQREPRKFYHHWDFALALISLGAKSQATEALEQADKLFQQEHKKEYHKAVAKLEELRKTPSEDKKITFEEQPQNVLAISVGKVVKYNTQRGFGFIKDTSDGVDVFFHITCVNGRTVLQPGTLVNYVRKMGEKGYQATKVWLLDK